MQTNNFVRKCREAAFSWLLCIIALLLNFIASAQPNITRVEYFVDTDPGIGNGISAPFSTGKDIQNLAISISPGSITEGVHRVYVRAMDANGNWALTNGPLMFYKTYTAPLSPPLPASKPKLVKMEYFFDADPGYGNGIPVVLDSLTDFNNYLVPINATGLTAGDHIFSLRALDKDGNWSMMNIQTVNVPSALVSPSIVVNSITKTLRCARDSFDISYDITGTYNAGNKFNVELSDAAGNFGSPTIIGSHTGTDNSIIRVYLPSHLADGNYKVRISSTNPVVTGVANESVINIHDRPAVQSVTGTINANATFSYNYSVPTFSGSTWKWIAPSATITQTDNTASLVWNTQGQPQKLQIVETNQHGCVGDTSVLLVNVYNLKIDNVVSSSLTPCPAGSITIDGKATGVYDGSNIFTAQLSDASGSFASPVNIGTVSASPVGLSQGVSINAILPFPLANGTGYRVRIVSNSPSVTGSDNSQNITVSKPDLGADQTVTVACENGTTDLTTLYNLTGLTPTYSTGTPNAAPAGNYTLYVANGNGCKDTAAISVLPANKVTVPTTPMVTKIASRECTDADGWTHYYNDNGTPADYSDDIRLLSIKKNGNNIGTVGDGTFKVDVAATGGAASNSGVNVHSPLEPTGKAFFSMNRYWSVTPTIQPTSSVGVRFYYNQQDFNDLNGSISGGGLTTSKIVMYKLNGGNPDPTTNWDGGTSNDYYSNGSIASLTDWVGADLGSGIFSAEFLVNSFSGGGAGIEMAPLPVTFISFDAHVFNEGIILNWSTATESNSKEFVIQRSSDGTRFENIGTVAAAGNSNSGLDYSFNDLQIRDLTGRTVFYRIKENDKDGQYIYSEVRKVTIPGTMNRFMLLYNPVRNEALFNYTATGREQVMIRVIDQLGRPVIVSQQMVNSGNNQIRIRTNNIAQGIYEVQLLNGKERFNVKMAKE